MNIGFTDRTGLSAPDPHRKVRVRCTLLEPRIKALLVVDAARVSAWLPRSKISIEEGGGGTGALRPGQQLRITMPAWLAEREGLTVVVGDGQGDLF